jgi:hypothetical protein
MAPFPEDKKDDKPKEPPSGLALLGKVYHLRKS